MKKSVYEQDITNANAISNFIMLSAFSFDGKISQIRLMVMLMAIL